MPQPGSLSSCLNISYIPHYCASKQFINIAWGSPSLHHCHSTLAHLQSLSIYIRLEIVAIGRESAKRNKVLPQLRNKTNLPKSAHATIIKRNLDLPHTSDCTSFVIT